MSPEACMMLEQEVWPIIKATVPRVCRGVGTEDAAELVQDTVLTAARMLDAAERAGKVLIARSIAHYAIQSVKSGRRALSAGRTDALGTGARMDARSVPVAIDGTGPAGDGSDWLDLLADGGEDPAQAAARRLDWDELVRGLDARERAIIDGLRTGEPQTKLAARLGVSPSRVCQLREQLRQRITERWGTGVLCDTVAEPCWGYGIRAAREREAARWERLQVEEQLELDGIRNWLKTASKA